MGRKQFREKQRQPAEVSDPKQPQHDLHQARGYRRCITPRTIRMRFRARTNRCRNRLSQNTCSASGEFAGTSDLLKFGMFFASRVDSIGSLPSLRTKSCRQFPTQSYQDFQLRRCSLGAVSLNSDSASIRTVNSSHNPQTLAEHSPVRHSRKTSGGDCSADLSNGFRRCRFC